MDIELVVAETRAWVDEAVIGLNLCPFAKAVQVKNLIRYVATAAATPDALREVLIAELVRLRDAAPEEVETTVLVHPQVLQDFHDFNDFLDEADAVLAALDLEGVLQVANFHPDFQFAGTDADDIGNATNRSPYPTLHLIREASIDRAVEVFPEAESIFEVNLETMEALGAEGWQALRERCRRQAVQPRRERQAGDAGLPAPLPPSQAAAEATCPHAGTTKT
jgi:uncharacterized protein